MAAPIWLGVASPKPQPRLLKSSMFGHVVDAFDEKTIHKIGEISPYEKRMKAQKEAEKKKEEKMGECVDRCVASEESEATGKAIEATNEANNHSSVSNGEPPAENNGIAERRVDDQIDNAIIVEKKIFPPGTLLTLIKGGSVVNDDCCVKADVLLQDNKIIEVSGCIEEQEGMKVIDASNKYILPGAIDITNSFGCAPFHGIIHSADDLEIGAKAALLGGTTLIVHNLEPEINQSYIEAYEELLNKLKANKELDKQVNGESTNKKEENEVSKVCCDVVVKVGLTWWDDKAQEQIKELANNKGINICYIPNDIDYPDPTILSICRGLKSLGVLLCVYPTKTAPSSLVSEALQHAGVTGPEGTLHAYPEMMELLSINRYLSICTQVNQPLYVGTISCREGVELVADKKRRGHVVFSEVALPSIAFDGSKLLDPDWVTAAHHVTHPPIRTHQNDHLLNQLATTDIQLLSSNHSCYSTVQKAYGKDNFNLIPPGIPSMQQRVALLWSLAVDKGLMQASRLVSCLSSTPAKLLGVYPRKGRVEAGSDADVFVLDPVKDHEYNKDNISSNIDFNVYEGMRFKGSVIYVIKDGRLVVDNGAIIEQHHGHILSSPCSVETAFERIKLQEQYCSEIKGVVREPYNGPISGQETAQETANQHPAGQRSEHFCRPPTRSGGRNMQDTTLSISVDGTYADDPVKCQKLGGYRVNQPPGGRTTQFW